MSYTTQKLKDISVIRTGKLDSNAAIENGIYPFFTCDPQTLRINTWAYDTEAVLLAGNNASGNYTAKYYCGKFNAYQRTYIIETADSEVLSIRFLCYAINQQLRLLKTMSSGSTTKFLTIRMLHNLDIPCPDIEVQSRIVNVLGNIDDLIENNQKQIKLLEEAAQRLYKEWFVDLHFPGYEDTPIIDGVPEGWTRKTVLECLALHIGGGWGKESPVGKNTIKGKVIRGTDINDVKSGNYNDVPFRYHTENDIKKRALKANDIVFELSNGNINNIGRCLLIDDLILRNCGDNTICASFCKLFRPLDRIHALTLYWEIQDMQSSGRMLPYKKQGANGINNFAFEDFLSHELLVPDDESLLKPLEDIMRKMSNIQSQFALLIQARDRLLPKLMSGEIEV
jgi:type I restriction enzyme S subunit